jgi:short-subunit dehydrogenase involved in D-alanine esterification of teichoic acids
MSRSFIPTRSALDRIEGLEMTSSLSMDAIRRANEDAHLKNPVGVFVGGTSGIGEHTALAFVQHSHNPTVYIVGRNAAAAENIITEMQRLNPSNDAKFYFLKHDLTLVSEADAVAKTILANESKVNLLFLSPGYFTLEGRNETTEGIDAKFSINYYARWRIVDKLVPLLDRAAKNNEPARVVSVLAAGNENKLDLTDLDLKHTYTFMKANNHFTTFNSLMVERFASLYPSVSFIHAYPGFVRSGIFRDQSWYVRLLKPVFNLVAITAEDSGERFFYAGAVAPEFATGAHLVGAKLNDVGENGRNNGYLSKNLQDKVWAHTEEIFQRVLGN